MEGSSGAGQGRPRGVGLVVLFVVLIGVALASAVLVPLAQGQSVSWSNFVNSYDWLVAAIIIILVIALALYATHQTLGYPEGRRERRRRRRGLDEPAMSAPGRDSAVAIARERYARGEISSQQFSLILSELGETPGSRTGR
jgi:uncharacterized membrane protein